MLKLDSADVLRCTLQLSVYIIEPIGMTSKEKQ